MTRDTEENVQKCEFANGACIHCGSEDRGDCQGWVSSPKREWVGLTDEEITELDMEISGRTMDECVRAIEAKLKERNT